MAAIAREVADALSEKGYVVLVQNYDIPNTADFVEAIHAAIKTSRDLVVLFTRDYEWLMKMRDMVRAPSAWSSCALPSIH
ncbi:MAG: TIR domain-containing protein [Beijerinckiaceae bacterium]